MANPTEIQTASPEAVARMRQAPAGSVVPQNVGEAIELAKTLYRSKLFTDVADEAQALVKILAGAELGIPPFSSMNSFHIVKGKVMLHYTTIAARVKQCGYRYRLIEDTDDVQEIEFLGPDGKAIGRSRFTREDAKRAGTQNMDRLPRTMLFARAMSSGARRLVPEAFNGQVVYSNEERADIEFDWIQNNPEPQSSAVEAVSQKIMDRTDAVDVDFDPFYQPAKPEDEAEQGALL